MEYVTVDAVEFANRQRAGAAAQLVDVRSASEFASGHVPGAVNIPLEQLELRTEDLGNGGPVVLVCQAGTRARIAAELLADSRTDLTVLEGGTDGWRKAGLPLVRCTRSRWALERQVRLGAGLLVILGVALGFAVSPWWFGLAAFVGCGLTFAGATNLCLMGEMLARMPWNRARRLARRSSGTGAAQTAGVCCVCEPRERR
jgi:rhodanese-related sulfurtransferase